MHGYRTYSRGAVDSSYCRLHYRKYVCTTRVHVSTPYVTICTFHDSYESYERRYSLGKEKCLIAEKLACTYSTQERTGKPVKMTMSSYRCLVEGALHAICRPQ